MMETLRVFTGNRLENLADALAGFLRIPPSSPLSPEVIVVQSKGMERWVSMQLAERHGVCANCRFPFPNAFIQEVFSKVHRDMPEPSLYDPDIMTWRIMKALPDLIEETAFKTIRIYLESGQTDLKRFQLSQRIADLFDQYLLFRPEMMFLWEKGRAQNWQALLWRRLVEGHEREHRAALAVKFFSAMEENPELPPGLPERIHVFGISALPRFHLQVLASLSRVAEVNLFLMNPCREYWGDIFAAAEMRKRALSENAVFEEGLHMEKGNSLLASMGALGRDFFEMIQDYPIEEASVFAEPEGEGFLASIQRDVLNLQERLDKKKASSEDLSVRIHSCHSPMREVEVLRDQLLRMFEEIPGLLPKDILVMMPNIESYAPYIQAVFDASREEERIPFSIADRSIRKEGGIGETLLNILDLEGSRFEVTRILKILECEAVRRRFGFSEDDLEAVRRWVFETRIRWGIDEKHKRRFGLPSFPQNTWRAGMERLLLGFAMPGRNETLFSGILPYDAVEGGETRILGSLAECAEKLFNRSNSLGQMRTLEAWQGELLELLDDFFEPGEEAEREILLIRRMVDDLARSGKASRFDERVHLRVVTNRLGQGLDQTGFGFGFMTGGVTFCAMLPMRSIPFRVICMLGMDGEAYPRQSKSLGFDYMSKYPRRGDRSRRNDDRYLFLEAILSARERLYISYVGQSIQDNSVIPPSVLVSELMDYLEQGFEIPGCNIRDHLHTRHRLQAFSPEYFKERSNLFTYSERNYEIAERVVSGRKRAGPFVTGTLSEPDETWRTVDLQRLCEFYANPAKFLLTRRLGLSLETGSSLGEEKEPFEVQTLERYLLEESMLWRRLQGRALEEDYPFALASGRLPHGTVGQCVYEGLSQGVEHFAQALRPLISEQAFDSRDFEIRVGGFSLAGSLDRVFRDKMVRYRYARLRARDFMVSWIHHLALNVARPNGFPRHTLLAGLSGEKGEERRRVFFEYEPPDMGERVLEELLKRYWEGLRVPLRFFPDSSRKYAELRLVRDKPSEAALEKAYETWQGDEWHRGENDDPYYALCFRESDPMDASFEEIALEVFEPLLKHLKERSR